MNNQQMKRQIDSGQHYYSRGDHLRDKHQLAGDTFTRWILDHVSSWASAKILDAGGGWGRFIWLLVQYYNVDPANTVITDISTGMLLSAHDEAQKRQTTIMGATADIQGLPFVDQFFDIVMANKVLYHLDDIPHGVSEISRVLRPDGILLASTNSEKINPLIIDLHYQAMDKLGLHYEPEPPSPFSMENGSGILSPYFESVETHYFEDNTWIDDAHSVRTQYETIGRYRNLLVDNNPEIDRVKRLPDTVEQIASDIITRDGKLFSPSLMGVFICRQPSHTN